MMSSTRMVLIAAVLAAALAPALALADPYTDVGFRGWGPRVGLSLDPDQVHFGAHFDYGNFAKHVRFQPNVEFGFGDNVNLYTLNAEAAYRFTEKWDVWSPYLGGGLGANIKSWDGPDNHNNSETDLGLNLLGGIEKGLSNGDRFFVETKLSLNDIPDVKITVGWTFYH
jgi:opacity protein-like surface antigen